MASFSFPSQVLHKFTEEQWFPHAIEEHESSLNSLEREEAAHQAKLESVAQKVASPPIGVAAVTTTASASAHAAAVATAGSAVPPVTTTVAPSVAPPSWLAPSSSFPSLPAPLPLPTGETGTVPPSLFIFGPSDGSRLFQQPPQRRQQQRSRVWDWATTPSSNDEPTTTTTTRNNNPWGAAVNDQRSDLWEQVWQQTDVQNRESNDNSLPDMDESM